MKTETICIESKDYEPVFWSTAMLYILNHNENAVYRYGKYTSARLEKILDKVAEETGIANITITLVDEWYDEPYIVIRDETFEEICIIEITTFLF